MTTETKDSDDNEIITVCGMVAKTTEPGVVKVTENKYQCVRWKLDDKLNACPMGKEMTEKGHTACHKLVKLFNP